MNILRLSALILATSFFALTLTAMQQGPSPLAQHIGWRAQQEQMKKGQVPPAAQAQQARMPQGVQPTPLAQHIGGRARQAQQAKVAGQIQAAKGVFQTPQGQTVVFCKGGVCKIKRSK
jgi:hypothetical protein